jgi:hypothetical protein
MPLVAPKTVRVTASHGTSWLPHQDQGSINRPDHAWQAMGFLPLSHGMSNLFMCTHESHNLGGQQV